MFQTLTAVSSHQQKVIFAASLFLLFNLLILLITAKTSFETAVDEITYTLSGRQRMLTERLTKTLLQIQTRYSIEQHSPVSQKVGQGFDYLAGTSRSPNIG